MGQDEGAYHERIRRAYSRVVFPVQVDLLPRQFFTEPLWQELLPPELPPHMQKPYTLLVSIDDLLVTSTWDVCAVMLLAGHLCELTREVASAWMADSKTSRRRLFLGIPLTILRDSHLHDSISLCKLDSTLEFFR